MKGVLSSSNVYICSDEEELEEIREFDDSVDRESRDDCIEQSPRQGAALDCEQQATTFTPRAFQSETKPRTDSTDLASTENHRKPSSDIKRANLEEQMEQVTPSRPEKIEELNDECTPSPTEKSKAKNSKPSAKNSKTRTNLIRRNTRSAQQSFMDMSYSIGLEDNQ